MENIILCEGSSDFVLLQDFMQKAYNWEDSKNQGTPPKLVKQKSRVLDKDNKRLTIMSCGGIGRIKEGLDLVLARNINAAPDLRQAFGKIVVIADRDSQEEANKLISDITLKLDSKSVAVDTELAESKWIVCHMISSLGITIDFQILILFVPVTGNGAMETFLLDGIHKNNPYEAQIVEDSRDFVQKADPEKRFLKNRGDIVKAEFSAFFCIRTPSEAFNERRNIIKTGVNWAEYPAVVQGFSLLSQI